LRNIHLIAALLARISELFAWDTIANRLVMYDLAAGRYEGDDSNLALEAEQRVAAHEARVEPCGPQLAN
jgi:hypothetical protein